VNRATSGYGGQACLDLGEVVEARVLGAGAPRQRRGVAAQLPVEGDRRAQRGSAAVRSVVAYRGLQRRYQAGRHLLEAPYPGGTMSAAERDERSEHDRPQGAEHVEAFE
jgi:hypothetical protein